MDIRYFPPTRTALLILLALALCHPGLGHAQSVPPSLLPTAADIILRPAPPKPPAEERLTYAQRLYQTDHLAQAKAVASEVIEEHAKAADEALFLLGRIVFSQGEPGLARRHFETLWLRYPRSPVIRDGRLVNTLSRATSWLLEDQAWPLAGDYLRLLRQLDPAAVLPHARALENRLDQERQRYQRLLAQYRRSLPTHLSHWLQARKERDCDFIGQCVTTDEACITAMERRSGQRLTEVRYREAGIWPRYRAKAYDAQRQPLVDQALEAVQPFALLRALVTDRFLRETILPRELPEFASPFEYRIIRQNFKGYLEGLRKYTRGRVEQHSWRVCRQLEPTRLQKVDFPVLRFGELNRAALLQRLGERLNSDAQRSPTLTRRKL